MKQIDPYIAEFDREAKTTRKLLERLPEDRLDWKPHEKSSTLGKLAMHIAKMPGGLAQAAAKDDFVLGGNPPLSPPASRQDVLDAFDESIVKLHDALGQIPDEKWGDRWSAKFGEKTVMDMPRISVVRIMILNHWYHHRGQLSVYLRLLDVAVPSIYGPSADENPFVA